MTLRNEFGLTQKQSFFVEKYIACNFNATQAYLEVYNCKKPLNAGAAAARVLAIPKVQAYVDKRKADMAFEVSIKKADLLASLLNIHQKCMDNEDHRTAIQAIAQISKMLGYDAPVISKVELEDKRKLSESVQKLNNVIKSATNDSKESI